MEDPKVEVS